MRIEAFHVTSFGVWRDVRLEGLAPGLNVLWGPNEAGKTTLLECVRFLFFGLPRRGASDHYPTPDGSPRAGEMTFLLGKDRYRLSRKEKGSPLVVPSLDVEGELLRGLGRELYFRTFAFGQEELFDIRAFQTGDVEGLLYRAESADGASPLDVEKELEGRIRALYGKGRGGRIRKLEAELQDERRRVRELRRARGEVEEDLARVPRLEESRTRLRAEIETAGAQLERLERCLRMHPLVAEVDGIDRTLETLPHQEYVEGDRKRLDTLLLEAAAAVQRVKGLQGEMEKDRAALPAVDAALLEKAEAFRKARRRSDKLLERARVLDEREAEAGWAAEIRSLRDALGMPELAEDVILSAGLAVRDQEAVRRLYREEDRKTQDARQRRAELHTLREERNRLVAELEELAARAGEAEEGPDPRSALEVCRGVGLRREILEESRQRSEGRLRALRRETEELVAESWFLDEELHEGLSACSSRRRGLEERLELTQPAVPPAPEVSGEDLQTAARSLRSLEAELHRAREERVRAESAVETQRRRLEGLGEVAEISAEDVTGWKKRWKRCARLGMTGWILLGAGLATGVSGVIMGVPGWGPAWGAVGLLVGGGAACLAGTTLIVIGAGKKRRLASELSPFGTPSLDLPAHLERLAASAEEARRACEALEQAERTLADRASAEEAALERGTAAGTTWLGEKAQGLSLAEALERLEREAVVRLERAALSRVLEDLDAEERRLLAEVGAPEGLDPGRCLAEHAHRRARLRAAEGSIRDEERELAALGSEGERLEAEWRGALESAGVADDAALAEACSAWEEAKEAARSAAAVEQRLRKVEERLTYLDAEAGRAEAEAHELKGRLSGLLEEARLPVVDHEATFDRVQDQLTRLQAAIRSRSSLLSLREDLEREIGAFLTDTRELVGDATRLEEADARLRLLGESVAAEEEKSRQAAVVRRRLEQRGIEVEEAEAALAKRGEALRELCAAYGVETPEALAERFETLAERDRLARARANRVAELETAYRVPFEKARETLAELDIVHLEGEKTAGLAHLRDLQASLQDVERELGRLGQVRDHAARDIQLAEVEARIERKEEEIDEAVFEQAVLVRALHILRESLVRYERERQPEVLREASRYLARFTAGAFRDVHFPLRENPGRSLFARRNGGEALPSTILSQGTADQLYLALRFAVLDRRNPEPRLPVFLDEVLVNFDDTRTLTTVRALGEIAEERQIFYLTCREAVARLFAEEAGAHVVPLDGGE